ncbi:MAG TPA: T9SS type A sorting domain-containing protein [Bacteroidales bacterium]|nr:T9SS type A sorting domain-containing protein [Bacteroidales bacterium]
MRGSDLLQVLGLKFMDDGLEDNVHDLNPKSDSLLARIRFEYLGGDSPHYSIDRMSATNSLPLYASADGFDRIFVKVQDNSYRVVSSTVTFGAIADGDSLSTKAYMMAEIVNYLLNISTITDLQEAFASFAQISAKAFPNPSSGLTHFEFHLADASPVAFSIYDATGRLVRQDTEKNLSAGTHQFHWHAADMPQGIYFYNIKTNAGSQTGKVVIR